VPVYSVLQEKAENNALACSEKQGRRVVIIVKIEDYPCFGEGLDPHLV
jgi:hypothetical protein